MGYFSNGCEGMSYEARWCDRCVHQAAGCAVWDAHLLANYEECNNEDSILHLLIPKTKDGLGNEQCRLFWEKGSPSGGQPVAVPVPLTIVKAA